VALARATASFSSAVDSRELVDEVREAIKRKGVYYPPVCACTVAYPKSAFKDVELPNGFGNLRDLPGFGSLNPRTEGVRTLGTLWSSSLFPGRCPPDYNVLLNYIGGSRDAPIAELSEEELVAEVDRGCREVLLKPDVPSSCEQRLFTPPAVNRRTLRTSTYSQLDYSQLDYSQL